MDSIEEDTRPVSRSDRSQPAMEARDLSVWLQDVRKLNAVSFDVYPAEILAFIGPAGSGKTTAIKSLARIQDDTRDLRLEGRITMHGRDMYGEDMDASALRRRIGWVERRSTPFPSSVFENVAYGARRLGLTKDRRQLSEHVEDCLRLAGLWEDVKDRLYSQSGLGLSGGQQKRLCIARALSTRPEVLLLDEPTGSIDSNARSRIEQVLVDLKSTHSVVLVTHSLMQARRIADRVVHFHEGEIMDSGATAEVFTAPRSEETRAFVEGVHL